MLYAESFHGIGTFILLLMIIAPSEVASQYPIPSLLSLIGIAPGCFRLFPRHKTARHYALMAVTTWLLATVASILAVFAFGIRLGNWR